MGLLSDVVDAVVTGTGVVGKVLAKGVVEGANETNLTPCLSSPLERAL